MLNIGRMAPGRAEYYLTAVARQDDGMKGYYLANGEEPGRWLGHGARILGLDGRVEAEQLRAVLAGNDPRDGARLAAHPARKVQGFDHTFRAPKSVSLLWALGDADTAAQVTAAHDAAVDAAVGYLERAAGFTRRGAGGAETVGVEGFVAAAFRHRTSRANDPLLHTHALVANLARTCDDGVWRTLDSRKLFAHAKTAGVLYQAQLRHELTRRLEVGWQHVVNGHADIDGVDRQLIEGFSRRRAVILDHMHARGETSAAAAQVATLATRQTKGRRMSEVELRAEWARRASKLGIDDRWYQRLVGRTAPQFPDVDGIARELIDGEALTEQASTFTRDDVLQAIADRLPTGAPVTEVERLAEMVLAHDPEQLVTLGATRGQLTATAVIRREDGRIVPADTGERRYTTRRLLLTEHHAINASLRRADAKVAVVDERQLEAAIGRRTLTAEQEAMVRRLTRSGAGVEIVVGKAGTGKTYALDAARGAWHAAGIPVTGAALAARAALELQTSSGIRSTTLARLLGQIEDSRVGSPLPAGSVLVVDEAGMVGTRQLARLLDHAAEQDVKVVLVGDPRQLPEIDAGGLFRALATRLPAVELTHNRRQTHTWEQAALDELRHGNPSTALAAYTQHGRIVSADTAEQVRDRLVDDWWDTARQDLPGSIMLALRRTDVDDLNHRARARMLADGRLTGAALHIGVAQLRVGDRIVCLRNDRRLGVVNGTRATITRIRPHLRQIDAVGDDDAAFTLPAGYLDAGHAAHGYAITGHKAQGLTVDHTYVLGTETLYREWGYVALSRGRESNQLYHGPTDELDGLHPHTHLVDEPTTTLASRLRRVRAQEPVSDEHDSLGVRCRQLETYLARPEVQRQRDLSHTRDELTARHGRQTRNLQAIEVQLAALPQGLRGLQRRQERNELRHQRVQQQAMLGETATRLADIDRHLAELPATRHVQAAANELRRVRVELQHRADRAVARHEHTPPRYLLTELGPPPPPPDPNARTAWRTAARAIEQHRLRWDITDPDQPFAAVTTNPTRSDEQRHIQRRLDDARRQLRPELQHDRARAR